MSELKLHLMLNKEMHWMPVYLKVDADKVIEGKDAKIIQLTALIENYNRIFGEIIDNANHQKYKRCLEMAKWCGYWADYWDCCEPRDCGMFIARARFFRKWNKRWLKIAEKFKKAL